jgi:trimeric autotransporter adhesin
LSPTAVTGTSESTGTVSISGPAPSGGLAVSLVSGNTAAATVPSSVTIAAGGTTAQFAVATYAVSVVTTLDIDATLGGVTVSAALTVNPAGTGSLTVNPAVVTGGTSSTGTVTLSGPAPAGGGVVALSSNNAAAGVPTSVTVPAGSISAQFTVTTSAVGSAQSATLTATYGGAGSTAILTVNPPQLSSVTLNPASVQGTVNSTGTVTLTGPAPAGGATVALASSNTAGATVPASVTVPGGSTTAQFTVTTYAVSVSTAVNINATFGGLTVPASLTVNPAGTGSLTLNPAVVIGGTSSTGTVTLSGAAPVGGAVVALNSNNAAASVPASVTVPAGSTSAAFTVSTSPVASAQNATLTAAYGGSSTTATLTVNPPQVSSLSLNPVTVLGTVSSAGTVVLTGPAPAGGALVALATSNPAAATVPASVTVPAGSISAGFTVSTFAVAASTGVTINASYGGVNAPASLTVNPPAVNSVSLNPATVTGGSPSTGTVVLTGVAPAGGAVVTLGSTNAAVAGVPASVTVPAGTTGTTFTVTTTVVASPTAVTITATYGGATGSAILTVSAPSITVPGAPTSVTATAGYAQATVSFTAPASNGGSPILSYTVTSSPGGITATGAASPIVVTGLMNGTAYTFTVQATNAAGTGPASTPSNSVTPRALTMDVQTWQDQNTSGSSIQSPSFTTASGNELLLAFVSTDGPSSGSVTVNSVTNSGTALTWTLVRRTNTQRGTSEIWRAFATGTLTTRVTARFNRSVAASTLTIVTFMGVDTSSGGAGAIGATAGAYAGSGAPTASLVTTGTNSWVFGVGNDWDRSVARTLGANQTMVHQNLPPGTTFWVQRQSNTTPLAGTRVTINCTAPTNDRWNLSIVEIRTP